MPRAVGGVLGRFKTGTERQSSMLTKSQLLNRYFPIPIQPYFPIYILWLTKRRWNQTGIQNRRNKRNSWNPSQSILLSPAKYKKLIRIQSTGPFWLQRCVLSKHVSISKSERFWCCFSIFLSLSSPPSSSSSFLSSSAYQFSLSLQ